MSKSKSYLLARLREPSTWSGLAALAVAFGVDFPAGVVEPLTQFGVGLAGLLGIVMKEGAK